MGFRLSPKNCMITPHTLCSKVNLKMKCMLCQEQPRSFNWKFNTLQMKEIEIFKGYSAEVIARTEPSKIQVHYAQQ